MYSSSDDDDEYDNNYYGKTSHFYFWNNWQPMNVSRDRYPEDRNFVNPNSTKYCNWLAPSSFGLKSQARCKKPQDQNVYNRGIESCANTALQQSSGHSLADWGARFHYGISYAQVEEGETIWNIFQVGTFGIIKLWKNEYGNISAYADAEIHNGEESGKALMLINQEQLLKKLLGVPLNEWTALIEALGDSKWSLMYEALKPHTLNNRRPIEKLWYFLCKRRHHLPCLSIRMRRTGVKKITQFLKILPKFTIEDLRTCDGQEIF